eukprot:CAMPEP_0197657204 /NCGR_PEP_ID=MMETSP1338-20131121/44486_1 /TAXON_ID=43686 ORGANISM="Pelagodinium beii, Strain RCC1491" /NCGR_SAMPLE_ID=MMETSP1338 /ASSEMBLY_ACC=CAM_ASM_000754 /LENGTH=113 /DNA_ID=CAMNT_0043233525 /DNA_START=396 /DNA_END=737 /DNA_ORIENTATION=-
MAPVHINVLVLPSGTAANFKVLVVLALAQLLAICGKSWRTLEVHLLLIAQFLARGPGIREDRWPTAGCALHTAALRVVESSWCADHLKGCWGVFSTIRGEAPLALKDDLVTLV